MGKGMRKREGKEEGRGRKERKGGPFLKS